MKNKKGFSKLLTGAFLGASLGLLFAPKKGSEIRHDLKLKIDDLVKKAKELDKEDVKETINAKIALLEEELTSLNKEKVLKTAKKKAKDIQDMALELVDYAVLKGTPVLESAAEAVRKKAIDVTKEVLKKLEDKD